MSTDPDWNIIAAELAAPFDPMDVDFRVQGKASTSGKVQVLAYIDARAVQERLDRVVGPQNWTFEWSPVAIDAKGDIQCAKGTITIYGIAKSDVGTASNFEGDKGAVSGAQKRAAVQWGIGRYLYALPTSWIPDAKFISDTTLAQLRSKLPKPGIPTPRVAAYQEPQQEVPASVTEKTVEPPAAEDTTPSTPDPWESLREVAELAGVDEVTWRAARKKYPTLEAMQKALDAMGKKPAKPEIVSAEIHLKRLQVKANSLGYKKAAWEQLVEDCHGDLDIIAQALEHAAQTDLRQMNESRGTLMNIFQIILLILAFMICPGVIITGILWGILDKEDDGW